MSHRQRAAIKSASITMTTIPLGIIVGQSVHNHYTGILILALISAAGTLLGVFGS